MFKKIKHKIKANKEKKTKEREKIMEAINTLGIVQGEFTTKCINQEQINREVFNMKK